METTLLTSAAFWQDDSSLIMVNDRDVRALREAEVIRPWLKNRADLSGHLLFATSGSTGNGKWIALSKSALLVSARAVNAHLKVTPQDRWMLSLPTFHVGGMGVCARVYDAGCGLTKYEGKWDAHKFWDQLTADKTTLVSLVPTQLVDLVKAELKCPPRLRGVLIGGGRLEDEVYQKAVGLGWSVFETYGMTETSSQIATAQVGRRELQVLPIWQVKLNQDGRLTIKGEALMTGYVGCSDGEVVFNEVSDDAWFLTGDVVEIHQEVLKMIGRADRCVKVLGELVDLDEIAKILSRVCGVSEGVDVVALSDHRRGVRLCAVAESDVLTAEGLSVYNVQCNPLWRIDSVVNTGVFPRSSLGKIQYSRLQQMAEQSLDRSQ